MHTSDPQWEFQLPLGNDHESPRTNNTSRRKIGRNQSPQPDNADHVKIPAHLHQYLTTTSRPSEVFSKLYESREKRLHLLLRRFTNQIQYGCRNPHCTTPTCLSYRKRHADVPLRRYTDVAARALAWRCVEAYANDSGDTSPDQRHNILKELKSKVKIKRFERGKGLCWNEPVIPWYENPNEYIKRREHIEQTRDLNGRALVQHYEIGLADMDIEGSQTGASPDGSVPREIHQNVHAQDLSAVNGFKVAARHLFNGESGEQTAHTECNLTASTDEPRLAPSVLASTRSVEPPKDTASFTQMLYDTPAVKSFDLNPSRPSDIDTHTHSKDLKENLKSRDAGSDLDRDGLGGQGDFKQIRTIAHSTATFKIINKSVMSWLVALVAQRPDDEISFDGSVLSLHMSIAKLARQSLHYCLAHPLRLLNCAEAWRLDITETSENCSINQTPGSEVNVPTPGKLPSNRDTGSPKVTVLLPSYKEAVMAYGVLSTIQPYHVVLDDIFAAIQYAYILPSKASKVGIVSPQLPKDTSLRNPEHAQESVIKSAVESSQQVQYLDDEQVAALCVLSLFSMGNNVCRFASQLELAQDDDVIASAEAHYYLSREYGEAFPHGSMHRLINRKTYQNWVNIFGTVLERFDANNDMSLLRLLEGTTNVISHRLVADGISKPAYAGSTKSKTRSNIVDLMISHICRSEGFHLQTSMEAGLVILDLMCIVLLKMWDRKASIKRTSPVGGALQMLAGLYRKRKSLDIFTNSFKLKFVADALDDIKMPLEWLEFREDTKMTHILTFSFLFEPANLVKYFRTINLEIMRRSFEHATINYAYAKHWLLHPYIPTFGGKEVLVSLRPQMARYFVLTVRRQNMLEDAIDQIWRRQHQELMRPLKVSLGKGEGEDGLDHGGVQQEFFRIIFAEALNADYGMFTIDQTTRMTWFQPESPEPLYKFEALGILMSLAVYNSVTLPITFPLAFYRKLLGHKVKRLEHIEDGWAELTKGLQALQDWNEGDVGDVIARTYEFSYEALGMNRTVDIANVRRQDPWPIAAETSRRHATGATRLTASDTRQLDNDAEFSGGNDPPASPKPTELDADMSTAVNSPSSSLPISEAPLVTNANRDQYIKDYIYWLTDKSIAPQFNAFSKGFHTCLDPVALSIFNPEALKTVIEGHTEIDIDELEATATYTQYTAHDLVIHDFWDIVRDMDKSQHKKLLEFVTASDRIPVSGISSITFRIQHNGEDDNRLPSSSTCYGTLLLPQYSSKEILKAKLEKAIENSIGFGYL